MNIKVSLPMLALLLTGCGKEEIRILPAEPRQVEIPEPDKSLMEVECVFACPETTQSDQPETN